MIKAKQAANLKVNEDGATLQDVVRAMMHLDKNAVRRVRKPTKRTKRKAAK